MSFFLDGFRYEAMQLQKFSHYWLSEDPKEAIILRLSDYSVYVNVVLVLMKIIQGNFELES